MDALGTIHTALGVASVATGTAVALQQKGTRRHRVFGWIYVLCMLGLNLTALARYRLTGAFNSFHATALLSLATLILGMLPTRARPFAGFFVTRHAYFMAGSYVGVLTATAGEILTRIPGFPFHIGVVIARSVVCSIGIYVMLDRIPGILRKLRR